MKLKYGFILAGLLSTSVMAQVATNVPAPTPEPVAAPAVPSPTPPETAAPVKKATTKAKKPAKKKTAVKKTDAAKPAAASAASEAPHAVPILANEPAVAIKNNVTIRGQARINSEAVGHLKKGDTVNVLEIVTLKHPKTDEPSKWARIALPAEVNAWVHTSFVDATNMTVWPKKLNLRTGPGENYSVVGTLVKGDVVKPMKTKGEWTEIESPTNAFAFVAAHLLGPKVSEPVATPVTPTQVAIETPAPVVTPTTDVKPVVAPPVVTPAIPTPLPAPKEEFVKRIIQREGIVGGTVSIQAPSHYQMYSLDNGLVMDYLYTTSTNLVLKRYKGMTVLVTGEEELDERWPNTPVLTVQKIQVVK